MPNKNERIAKTYGRNTRHTLATSPAHKSKPRALSDVSEFIQCDWTLLLICLILQYDVASSYSTLAYAKLRKYVFGDEFEGQVFKSLGMPRPG